MSTVEDAAIEEALEEPAWPRLVTLAHPVDFGSRRIAALEFRRGQLGDVKGMTLGSSPSVDQIMLIASRMCGQPIKVIEKLDAADAAEVLEIALGFFARCLGAGKARSR